jgi:hypothetical protein
MMIEIVFEIEISYRVDVGREKKIDESSRLTFIDNLLLGVLLLFLLLLDSS